MTKLKVENLRIDSIIPYENNAKEHPTEQVEHIANSIKAFGWQQPIVIDKDNIVIIGHGRLLAAKSLNLKTVPVVRAEDLTEDQVKALRLIDNKTNESPWDYSILAEEYKSLTDINLTDFGFDPEINESNEVDIKEAEGFVEKVCCPRCGHVWEE